LFLASVLSFRARIKAAVKQQIDRVNRMIMGFGFRKPLYLRPGGTIE
jgi:hypothetical protein